MNGNIFKKDMSNIRLVFKVNVLNIDAINIENIVKEQSNVKINNPPSLIYIRNISIIWFEPLGVLWIIIYMNVSKHICATMAITKKNINDVVFSFHKE